MRAGICGIEMIRWSMPSRSIRVGSGAFGAGGFGAGVAAGEGAGVGVAADEGVGVGVTAAGVSFGSGAILSSSLSGASGEGMSFLSTIA